MVAQEFKKNCNLQEIVVLEPLRNEATRHVDMFAAFVAHNHVVVASLDRRADPVNASVLDRNVKKEIGRCDGRWRTIESDAHSHPGQTGKVLEYVYQCDFCERLGDSAIVR